MSRGTWERTPEVLAKQSEAQKRAWERRRASPQRTAVNKAHAASRARRKMEEAADPIAALAAILRFWKPGREVTLSSPLLRAGLAKALAVLQRRMSEPGP